MSAITPENWRPVPGHEDRYMVSDLGRVYSLFGKGRVLKPRRRPGGHLSVDIRTGGKPHDVSIHRLVLLAFVGPCPDGMWGLHWDDDPTNNRLENLRWGTPSDNSLDSVRNGTHYEASSTACDRGHDFTPENTIIRRGGKRRCRTCQHAAEVAYRERRRALVGVKVKVTATVCCNGHEYTAENTYIDPSGQRWCRECRRARGRKHDQKRRGRGRATKTERLAA